MSRHEFKDARLLCIKIDSTYTANIAEIPCFYSKSTLAYVAKNIVNVCINHKIAFATYHSKGK